MTIAAIAVGAILAFALVARTWYRIGHRAGKVQRDEFLHEMWAEENHQCLQLVERCQELEARLDQTSPGWRLKEKKD